MPGVCFEMSSAATSRGWTPSSRMRQGRSLWPSMTGAVRSTFSARSMYGLVDCAVVCAVDVKAAKIRRATGRETMRRMARASLELGTGEAIRAPRRPPTGGWRGPNRAGAHREPGPCSANSCMHRAFPACSPPAIPEPPGVRSMIHARRLLVTLVATTVTALTAACTTDTTSPRVHAAASATRDLSGGDDTTLLIAAADAPAIANPAITFTAIKGRDTLVRMYYHATRS